MSANSHRLPAERVIAIIEACGAEPRRWPAAEREAALAAIAATPALFVDHLDAARALDSALDGWQVAAPPASLSDAILAGFPRPLAAAAPATGGELRRLRVTPSVRAWTAALSSLAAGLAIGVGLAAPAMAASDQTAAIWTELGSGSSLYDLDFLGTEEG